MSWIIIAMVDSGRGERMVVTERGADSGQQAVNDFIEAEDKLGNVVGYHVVFSGYSAQQTEPRKGKW